eukprot:6944506-Alexandrium_andersonii.AAC.1
MNGGKAASPKLASVNAAFWHGGPKPRARPTVADKLRGVGGEAGQAGASQSCSEAAEAGISNRGSCNPL